jgi:hypothetical protein
MLLMPLADNNQAAILTFDAAVHRALSRRLSDTPWPHNGVAAPSPAPAGNGASAASRVGPDGIASALLEPEGNALPAIAPGGIESSLVATE